MDEGHCASPYKQLTMRVGASWQAHLGKLERCQAQHRRFSHRQRAQLTVNRPRSAMLLQDRHRWVHLQHAHILVVLGDIASPIALGKLYRTDQVRQVANE